MTRFCGSHNILQTSANDEGQRIDLRCPPASMLIQRKVAGALLVQRIEALDARFSGGAESGWVDAKQCIFLRAEGFNAGLVLRNRFPEHRIAYVEATHGGGDAAGEEISALAAVSWVAVVGEHGVNHAACSHRGNARNAQTAAQGQKSRRIPGRRISALVGDLSRGDD